MKEWAGANVLKIVSSLFLCSFLMLDTAYSVQTRRRYYPSPFDLNQAINQANPLQAPAAAIEAINQAPIDPPAELNPHLLIYEKAGTRDISAILELYVNFTADDKFKLVVYPFEVAHNGMISGPLRDKVGLAVRKGRIWIARDPNTRKIVSMHKLFIFDNKKKEDAQELDDTLTYELRCKGPSANKISDRTGEYLTFFPGVYQFVEEPTFKRKAYRYQWDQTQTYLYYGGAYTIPSHRGKSISSILERKALDSMRNDIISAIRKNKSDKLFYIYGVVDANSDSRGRVRIFSEYAHRVIKIEEHLTQDYFTQPTSVISYTYRAYKPNFVMINDKCTVLPDDNLYRGYGCLLCFDLTKNTHQ